MRLYMIEAEMKILQVNYCNKQKDKSLNFKNGLTTEFVNKSANYNKIKNKVYAEGLKYVWFNGCNAVAASCLATIEIMKSFGFQIPQGFAFAPLESLTIGEYSYPQ